MEKKIYFIFIFSSSSLVPLYYSNWFVNRLSFKTDICFLDAVNLWILEESLRGEHVNYISKTLFIGLERRRKDLMILMSRVRIRMWDMVTGPSD
jgi:hypothetical protein